MIAFAYSYWHDSSKLIGVIECVCVLFIFCHIPECLPTKGYFQENKSLSVEVRSATDKEKSAKISQKDVWISMHIPIAIAVIAAWVFVVRYEGTVPYLASIEAQFSPLGYHFKKEVMMESIINGLGWALMHLFVRRMLNPENEGKWFDGYFLDSCYGGLAAFGQTLFKGFILVTIMRKYK